MLAMLCSKILLKYITSAMSPCPPPCPLIPNPKGLFSWKGIHFLWSRCASDLKSGRVCDSIWWGAQVAQNQGAQVNPVPVCVVSLSCLLAANKACTYTDRGLHQFGYDHLLLNKSMFFCFSKIGETVKATAPHTSIFFHIILSDQLE